MRESIKADARRRLARATIPAIAQHAVTVWAELSESRGGSVMEPQRLTWHHLRVYQQETGERLTVFEKRLVLITEAVLTAPKPDTTKQGKRGKDRQGSPEHSAGDDAD